MGLTMKEKKSVIQEMAVRYAKMSKKEKSNLLNECVALTGYNRKYATTVLNTAVIRRKWVFNNKEKQAISLRKKTRKKRIYPRYYDNDVKKALWNIWVYFDRLCSARLVPFIRENIEELSRIKSFGITDEVKAKLVTVSSATVDRLLKEKRQQEKKLYGISTTKPAKNLNSLVPIRVYFNWDERKPGFFEVDTVSHDGGNASGEHCYTFSATDVNTAWTEIRALPNKAHRHVLDAVKDIRTCLPYPLKGLDGDNGSEIKNYSMLNYCNENNIQFTRSRSYHKNDNCFIEQKNFSVVRHLVGYYRYEGEQCVKLLNELYKPYCLLVNYFYPSLRIISKERVEAKVYKKYDKAKTPFTRTIESDDVAEDFKIALIKKKEELSLFDLKNKVDEALDNLLNFIHNKVK